MDARAQRRLERVTVVSFSSLTHVALAGMVILLGGCYATGGRGTGGSSEAKFTAEAYSFNARLWREGKPNTFKLEVYQTDSLIGLSGRGYLGKGALRGWLNADSIKVYFPASNELLYESFETLVASSSCPVPLSRLDLMQIFEHRPDSISLPDQVSVNITREEKERAEFLISSSDPECAWELTLKYRRRDAGWRISEFDFDDGESTRLKGSCELYRDRARVPISRVEPAPKSDATRIIP